MVHEWSVQLPMGFKLHFLGVHHETTLLCVFISLFTGILSKKKTKSGIAVPLCGCVTGYGQTTQHYALFVNM